MKRTLLPLTFLLFVVVLSGCGNKVALQYSAEWEDAARAGILIDSIERVLVRRFAALEIENPSVAVVPQSQTMATVTVEIPNEEDQDAVRHVFESPFTFDLRVEAGTVAVEDIETVDWQPTGIDGSMVEWVQAVGNTQTGEVSLELQFSEDGKRILENLAATQQGKRVGIFVRDVLVSALTIQSGSFADTVVIGGIPSATVAEIFADDVNVGLHVTFSPL